MLLLDNQASSETVDPEIGVKRAYLIWLWMSTLKNQTFERVSQEGGGLQMGQISQGAVALEQTMNTMSIEFPMFVIAKFIVDDYNKNLTQSCEDYYYKVLQIVGTFDDAYNLCTDSQYFDIGHTPL